MGVPLPPRNGSRGRSAAPAPEIGLGKERRPDVGRGRATVINDYAPGTIRARALRRLLVRIRRTDKDIGPGAICPPPARIKRKGFCALALGPSNRRSKSGLAKTCSATSARSACPQPVCSTRQRSRGRSRKLRRRAPCCYPRVLSSEQRRLRQGLWRAIPNLRSKPRDAILRAIVRANLSQRDKWSFYSALAV